MEWRPFLVAFVTIFLAELGDKTQLAALVIAADQQSPWMVFAGTALALTLVSAIAVLLGHVLGVHLPEEIIRYVAAAIFVVMGVLIAVQVI